MEIFIALLVCYYFIKLHVLIFLQVIMVFGYARVSTQDQNLSLQITALQKYGCDKIYSEKKSGVKQRPELERMIDVIRTGDIVVIWKLDRLARSLSELIAVSEQIKNKGADLVSIDGYIDTTTAVGRMFFHITGAFAEFERNLIVERTKAGLAEAKARGVQFGRKKGLTPEGYKKAKAAKELYIAGNLRPIEICNLLDISTGTLYRYLQIEGVSLNNNPGRKKKTA